MVQIIVPTATAGVDIVRGIGVWGRKTSDHCEVKYEDVRVPLDKALGRVGEGHQAAQDRLGAGRIYHCMNSVGQMWRAFDMMVERARSREVHGGLQAARTAPTRCTASSSPRTCWASTPLARAGTSATEPERRLPRGLVQAGTGSRCSAEIEIVRRGEVVPARRRVGAAR